MVTVVDVDEISVDEVEEALLSKAVEANPGDCDTSSATATSPSMTGETEDDDCDDDVDDQKKDEPSEAAVVESDEETKDEAGEPAEAGTSRREDEDDKDRNTTDEEAATTDEKKKAEEPQQSAPPRRSPFSVIWSALSGASNENAPKAEQSSDNSPPQEEQQEQDENGEDGREQAVQAVQTAASNSTLSSTGIRMDGTASADADADPDNLVEPTASKESLDAISLPELGTSTTVDSNEPVLSSTDFGISVLAATEVDVDALEADVDVDKLAENQQLNHQQEQLLQDNSNQQQAAAAHAQTSSDNNSNNASATTSPQGPWNEILNEDDLNEEHELKAARSSSGDTDTDDDSTLPPGDSSSSNTVQTADEAGTDTTYDTDGSLSTASAVIDDEDEVDVDELIRRQPADTSFGLVSPLMAGNDDDDDDDDDNDDEIDHHEHPIMPQQPELLMATAALSSLDAAPTTSGEEEKTEVDEYHPIISTNGDDGETRSIEELALLPEPPDANSSALEPPTSTRSVRFADDIPPIVDNNRAEYVSATILKREAALEHGLEFRRTDRELRVARISDTGLFANSPLAPLDRVMRINDLNVEQLDPVNASHLLDVLTGSITIIAQNRGGKRDLVESLITKPAQASRTGMEFKMVTTDEELLKQQVEIARIGQKSLFSKSLLHVGDRVLSVNQCEDLDSHTADLLLSSALDHCTVLARTKLKTKMAIARRPTHQLPPNFNFVRAMEEARRHREELRRKQGCYYNSCERPGACANIFQWLGNVYVITIVIVGVSISWSTVKEQTYDGSDAVGTILKFMGLFVGGILLGFLVNAPWWFRKVGARFSIAQLVCNVIVVVSYFLFTLVFDTANYVAEGYEYGIFFGLFFPLLIIVNLPSVFVKREDGSDGNTISDRDSSDDDLSIESNDHRADMV